MSEVIFKQSFDDAIKSVYSLPYEEAIFLNYYGGTVAICTGDETAITIPKHIVKTVQTFGSSKRLICIHNHPGINDNYASILHHHSVGDMMALLVHRAAESWVVTYDLHWSCLSVVNLDTVSVVQSASATEIFYRLMNGQYSTQQPQGELFVSLFPAGSIQYVSGDATDLLEYRDAIDNSLGGCYGTPYH
jgi:hypothetical protein